VIGLAFNPGLIAGTIPLPKDIRYLEAGAAGCANVLSEELIGNHCELSLHIPRAPFCEDPEFQREFAEQVSGQAHGQIKSVGVHLSGSYRDVMGHFGIGSGFVASNAAVETSRRFVGTWRKSTSVPLLIENANSYDLGVREAIAVIRHLQALCEEFDICAILDLSHLVMCAHNVGVDSQFLLGHFDLKYAEVIHLSGVRIGGDGLYHDCHGSMVSDEVWRLLELVLNTSTRPLKIVIEHTDPTWSTRTNEFDADFYRLREAISKPRNSPTSFDLKRIALGYFANVIVPQRLPQLATIVTRDTLRDLLRRWADVYSSETSDGRSEYYSFRGQEVFPRDSIVIDPIENFYSFVAQRLAIEQQPLVGSDDDSHD
jgi:hypothetical protein